MKIMVNKKIKYLENLLIWFHYFAQKYKLNYWLDFGTLLGIYRDKCIIPWDKDVDVGIDIRQAEFLVKCLLKDGIPFSWARQPPYHSLIHIGDLDVFFWKLEEDTYYSLHPWCQKSYFPYHFVEKMETLEFKNIPFNVPNNLPEFLKRRYGPDFMTPRKDVTGQNRENNANKILNNELQKN
jgi:phosphorylcholine metabolism protein LicD